MPIKYLGCPIFYGRNKASHYQDLIDSIRGKVEGWSSNLLNQAGRLVLINHVLNAMPIHLFAALMPPKAVIKGIDRILCNFFWRDQENSHKCHWISWVKCCLPKECGGLGIKRFKDVLHVQSLKLNWKLEIEDSLWANFMKTKYKKGLSNHNHHSISSSTVWKRIHKCRNEAMDYFDTNTSGKQWKFSQGGKFSSKLTWQHVFENNSQVQEDYKYIWNKNIPKRISVFGWKLLHGRLPLDDNVRRLGIPMVSRCQCCRVHKEENHEHVFLNSEIAKEIWGKYECLIGIKTYSYNLRCKLRSWWKRAKMGASSSVIFHVLPIVICWEMWKGRNNSVYDEIDMQSNDINREIRKTFGDITNTVESRMSKDLKKLIYEIHGRNGINGS